MDDLSTLWAHWQANIPGRERFVEAVAYVSGRSKWGSLMDASTELETALPSMRDWLCDELGVDRGSDEVLLFRGVSDEAATDIRVAVAKGHQVQISTAGPLSYSRTPRAALAFARKGAANGLVYATRVRLADICFVDRPGTYVNENYLSGEEEVVVWHRETPRRVEIITLNVEPGAGSAKSLSDAAKRLSERQRIERREADLLNP